MPRKKDKKRPPLSVGKKKQNSKKPERWRDKEPPASDADEQRDPGSLQQGATNIQDVPALPPAAASGYVAEPDAALHQAPSSDEPPAQHAATLHAAPSPAEHQDQPASFIPDEAFFQDEGLSELSEISLWKVSEVIDQPRIMPLGIQLGIPLPTVQQLDGEVRNSPSDRTETTFRMLHGWHRDQVEGETKMLYDVLSSQQFGFPGDRILQLFEAEVYQSDSDFPRAFSDLQLMNIAEEIHFSKHTPLSLRLGLSYNRISAINKDRRNDSRGALYQVLVLWKKELSSQVDQPGTMAKVLEACQEKKLAYQVRRDHLIVSDQGKTMAMVPQDITVPAENPTDVKLDVRYPKQEVQEQAQGVLQEILSESPTTLISFGEATAFVEELRSISLWTKSNWEKLKHLEKKIGRDGMYNLVGFTVRSILLHIRVYSQEGLEWLKRDVQSGLIGQRLSEILVPEVHGQHGESMIPRVTIEGMPGHGGIVTTLPDSSNEPVGQREKFGPTLGVPNEEQSQDTGKNEAIVPDKESQTEVLKGGASSALEMAYATPGTDTSGSLKKEDHIKSMDDWTEDEVMIWLKDEVKFSEDLVNRFDGVDGFTLARLQQKDLRDFELSMGHCKKLMIRREDYLQRVRKEQVRGELSLSPLDGIEQTSKVLHEVEQGTGHTEEVLDSASAVALVHPSQSAQQATVSTEMVKKKPDELLPLPVEIPHLEDVQNVTESVNLMSLSDTHSKEDTQSEVIVSSASSDSLKESEIIQPQVPPSRADQISKVQEDLTSSSHHEARSSPEESQSSPLVKKKVVISSETEKKLTNLLLGMDKGKLDNSYYPVLVVNTPREDLSVAEKIKDNFGFMSTVGWNAVFDCNPNSNKGGLCQYVNGEKPIKILSAETFTETKDVDALREGIEFPEVPVWLFPNGRNDVEERREETLSDQDWVRDRSNDVLSAVRFFSDPSVIPHGRAVVVFLLLSDADFMVMTHIFREFYSSKSFQSLKYFTVIAKDQDVMQKWITQLESIVSSKNMSERCLGGVRWEEINSCMMHLMGSCETQLRELPLFPKGSCPLHKKHQSQWSDIAVLAKNECENTSMDENNPNFEDFARDKELSFYKGQDVDWWNLYLSEKKVNKGKGFNHVLQRAVARKLHVEVSRILNSRGKKAKHISMVTVFHEAGSGGTTVAKNVMWDFHQEYRCATVKRITNDTVRQIMEFKNYGYHQSGKGGPVIILLESQDLESIRLFLANLEQETRCLRDDGIAFVLIHCKRTTEPERLEKLPENKPCVAVQHKLTEEEKDWFELKTKELEDEGVFREKDSPETLLAFMVMKNECDHSYVQNLVQRILPPVNQSSKGVQNAVSVLKYIAAIHPYNPDFAMPVSACDEFMHTEQRLTTSGHRQTHTLWEKNKPKFLDLLLKEELIQDIDGCVPGLGIVHHSVAKEIVEQLGKIYNQTQADMILELMEKSPILDTRAYSRGYIKKACRDLLVRRLKREHGDDRDTSFAPFVEDVCREDKDKAFIVMELCVQKFKDPYIAQQLARLYRKYESDYEKAELAIDTGIGFMCNNSYFWDTKGNILRWKMSKYKEERRHIEDDDMTNLIQIFEDACAAFQKAQTVEDETTKKNYVGFLNEIMTVFEFLGIVAERVTPFSRGNKGLQDLQKYLITEYVPPELKLEAMLQRGELMKGLVDRVEIALSRFVDSRIHCAKQRFGSAKHHSENKKVEIVIEKRNHFFALSDPPRGKRFPMQTVYAIRRSEVKKMHADGYRQIFDLASKNKVEELRKSKALLKENLGSHNLFDVKNYIFISFALSIYCEEILDEEEIRSLLPVLKRREDDCYGLFFEMMLNWPDGSQKRERKSVSGTIQELRHRWKDRYDKPRHGTDQQVNKRSKIHHHNVNKAATEFYLGHPKRRSKFVHRQTIGRITYSVWKEEEVKENLARLDGTLDSKNFVLYKPEGESEPMKIRLSLPLTGLPSQEPVEFYLGFSFAGPLAYDVAYKDNRETPFLARETLFRYPGYIHDVNDDSGIDTAID